MDGMIYVILLLSPWLPLSQQVEQNKIAIIGAGVGGSSVAYYLSQQLPDAEITVLEAGARAGGRLASLQMAGREYEVGGAIIHPENRLMADHLALCGLRAANHLDSGAFSLVSGGRVVFQHAQGLYGYVQLVLRYGLWSLIKLEYFVANLLANFGSIYPRLANGEAFASVEELLEAMSPVSKHGERSQEMIQLTKESIGAKLRSLSISEELIGELATIAMKVNYGQFPDSVHGFVGSVSLAGIQPGLWSVYGGNRLIPACLLKLSKAELAQGAAVSSVAAAGPAYTVTYTTPGSALPVNRTFDTVVLALPLTADNSGPALLGIPDLPDFAGHYQRTLAYLVHGALKDSIFGAEGTRTNEIFFIDQSHPVASISLLSPVDYDPKVDAVLPSVYKVFSRQEMTLEDLQEYFSEVKEYTVADWRAYPDYSSFPGLGSFRLHDGLYYLNSIEWAASAMEMSSLAARNVANLIANQSASHYPRKNLPKTEL